VTANLQARLRGYRDQRLVEKAISDGMIDIAYVDRVEDHCVVLTVEPDIDIGNDEDFDWLRSVISETLTEVGETTVVVERATPPGTAPSN